MRKFLLAVLFILFAFPAYALELLMAHNPACHICEKFIKEVAVDYKFSYNGRDLPLIIIPVHNQPEWFKEAYSCLLYTSPSPRDVEESRMPSSA